MIELGPQESFDGTNDGGQRRIDLGPVAVPDAPEVLASLLRAKILSGELEEGTPLPPERVLMEQTKLSRPTVRESLRILQLQGLVVRRRGRNGGPVIARPVAQDVIGWLDLYLQGRRLDTAVLLEVREIIEPWCAALAAERRNEQDLRQLQSSSERMREAVDGELDIYLQANLAWHIAVADGSHNELLAALMHALSKMVLRQTGGDQFNTPEVRAAVVRAHDLVTKAIEAGDSAAARRRMARHLHAFATALLAAEPKWPAV